MTPADLPPDTEVAVEAPAVEFHGAVQASMSSSLGEEAPPTPSIDMARFQGKLDHGAYSGMLQVELAGQPRLLDAVAQLGRPERLTLRAGRFKTPLSLDFGVPAPKMLLPSRALLVAAAPQRAIGADLEVERGWVDVHIGAFEPSEQIEDLHGIRPVAAADVHLPHHWMLHAGASAWLRDNGVELNPDDPEWDEVGDLAVAWEPEHSTFALEGLVGRPVLDPEHWETGVTAVAAHRFPAGSTEVEPALGWDTATLHHELKHRLSGSLNVHVDDWFAVARLSAEATWVGEETMPGVVGKAQLQVGL